MKILVAIKRVVDPAGRVRIKPDGSTVDIDNLKMAMNPFDEVALEAALRLRDGGDADQVIVLSIGTAKVEETLRTALAMGADRGILIEANEAVEPLAVAKVLQRVVEEERPSLVLLGKQAIDDDNGQTGQMLAALLGWGQATFASDIKVAAGDVIVTREVDGGLQVVGVTLPGVITSDLRLNTPRFTTLPNIMRAKSKPIDKRRLEDFGLDTKARLAVLKTEFPKQRQPGVKVSSVAELVDKLRNEAAVL